MIMIRSAVRGGWGSLVGLAIMTAPAQAVEKGGDVQSAKADAPTAAESIAALSPGLVSEELAGEPMRISMDFKDADLKTVLKTFSEQTGINVIASEEVGRRTITLYLEDVTVMDALDRILASADLVSERPAGSQIYVVKPKPAETGEAQVVTVTRVYRLKFARVSTSRLAKAVEALGAQTPFEAKQLTASTSTGSSTGASGGAGGTGGAGGGGVGGGGGGGAAEVGIDNVIENLLTSFGKVVVDGRTNSLIVTDLPDNFARIDAVLRALDIKTAQVLVEAELLETSLSKLKDLGVEWGTGSEGTLLKLSPATRTTRFPFSTFLGEKTGDTTKVTLGTINTSLGEAVLDALERDTDTKILARPRVLTLDNESAVIRLTNQQAVAVQTTTVATGAGITQTTPERMTTGVILVVTPQVNEDDFITMLIEPSVTKVVASLISSAIKDPKSRSARALVRVRNGQTLVMGGLIDRSEQEVLQRVPILSGIPVLGAAFKNKEIDNTASELIVFITPRIVDESMAAQRSAAAAEAPLQAREQEPTEGRQQEIEQRLNVLEREQHL